MYGIVNKAIEDLVVQKGGPELWTAVCAEAGIDPLTFVAQEIYPDAVTYDLVGAVSKVTGIPTHDILVSFGQHWSQYTGNQGYGQMFKMLGSDLVTFLRNLPRLHDHVAFIFPDLKMPRFETEILDERHVRVWYRSDREGLSPMTFGLLQGMGTVYKTNIRVTQEAEKGPDSDAAIFLVEIIPSGAG